MRSHRVGGRGRRATRPIAGLWLVVAGLLVLAFGGRWAAVACADEQQQQIQDLQKRIEAMELQNQKLMRALHKQELFGDADDGAGIVQVDDNDPEPDEPYAGEDDHIRSVIRDYLAAEKASATAEKEPEWHEIGKDLSMTATWKNGLEIESKNKDFRVHVGGRTQFDVGWFQADQGVQDSLPPTSRFRDGVDFRRARLRVDGKMYETMEWAAEFDFVNSAGVPNVINLVAPTDLWWQFNDVPLLQNFRVGNQKEPIGFEHLMSSRFLNFMERSYLQDAFFGGFNNGFAPGAQFFGNMAEERMTYAAGVFSVPTNVFGFNTGSGEYAFSARATALPWYVDDGKGLLHLGVSAREWTLDEGQARFRTRASVRAGASANWPIIADTGLINADDNQQVNAELVGQLGSFSFVAEYLTSWLQRAEAPLGNQIGPVIYRGGYVEALYFLTGEHRAYNRKTGVFDRVVPHENAFLVRGENGAEYGLGAWQLAARYQFLDLNSNGINGGILHDTTLGVNWYLNPNFKVQANYFFMQREGFASAPANGPVQGFGIRLAHDF